MRHTEAYERMTEQAKLSIRMMERDFYHACKYRDDNRIRDEKLRMLYYTDALKDTKVMTYEEVEELWEVMTEAGSKAYHERISNK